MVAPGFGRAAQEAEPALTRAAAEQGLDDPGSEARQPSRGALCTADPRRAMPVEVVRARPGLVLEGLTALAPRAGFG
jgi:hypothetical protein